MQHIYRKKKHKCKIRNKIELSSNWKFSLSDFFYKKKRVSPLDLKDILTMVDQNVWKCDPICQRKWNTQTTFIKYSVLWRNRIFLWAQFLSVFLNIILCKNHASNRIVQPSHTHTHTHTNMHESTATVTVPQSPPVIIYGMPVEWARSQSQPFASTVCLANCVHRLSFRGDWSTGMDPAGPMELHHWSYSASMERLTSLQSQHLLIRKMFWSSLSSCARWLIWDHSK